MNNSVHVTWGSWTVAGRGLYCSSGQERGGEDVSQVYAIHTETVHPFEEEGKWVRDCLLFKKNLERNTWVFSSDEGLMQRPATLFCFLFNLLLLNFCLTCTFLHFKSFGNDFLCLSLIHPKQLDKSDTLLWLLVPILCCVLQGWMSILLKLFPLVLFHQTTPWWRDSWAPVLVHPPLWWAGGVGQSGACSLLFGKKQGSSGAPWGTTFPVSPRAKPGSRGRLTEGMALHGVCRKEPTGSRKGRRQVWVCISDT